MRTVRRFSDRRLSDEVLCDILEVGRWTGSAKNTQPWDIVVVRDRAVLERLARLGPFAGHLAGANVGLMLVMDGPRNAFDAGRLTERLCLAAWLHGVGSAIASISPDDNAPAAKEILKVPHERWLREMISLGYPADAVAHRVRTTPQIVDALPALGRRPLSEVVSWERYGVRARPT